MRKCCIFLLAAALFFSCNYEKTGNASKEKESNNENKHANEAKDKKSTGLFDRDDTPDQDESSSSWKASEIREFLNSCVNKAVSKGSGKAVAEEYCSCMQKKLEKRYPDTKDLVGLDLESPSITRMAEDCRTDAQEKEGGTKSGWSRADVMEFVNSCVDEAERGGMESLDAQSYCDCMQYKLEKLYPDPEDVAVMTEADFRTPSMKRMIRDCQSLD